MTLARILVVDDEPGYLKLLRYNLESKGYDVITASGGQEALSLAARERLDLIILDLRLRDLDGYEVCRRVREFSFVPIVMVTARGEERDKVRGLRLGADDYITKPFGADELLARVEAVLRRGRLSVAELRPVIKTGDIIIDSSRHKVSKGGQELKLTPTEFRLLHCLAVNVGKVVVQEDLQEKVWGPEYREYYEGLRVFIRRLRQKIEQDPDHPARIVTVPGVGYMLTAPPEGPV
ncbi:MAG: response regulator transcription factor [Chloroflexi bacterium]|nr:response regulator transcription factor [Chloroflexota bacterium]